MSSPLPPYIVSSLVPPVNVSFPSNPFIIKLLVSVDLSIVSFDAVPLKVIEEVLLDKNGNEFGRIMGEFDFSEKNFLNLLKNKANL